MKNTIAILLFILAFTGCDKIKHPDQRPPVVYHCVDTATQIVQTNTLTSNTRKVLVEDYTGHLCPNCPPAAVAAEGLISTYNKQVVIIANHISKTFARPINDSTFKEDFRNPTSTLWDDVTFKISGTTGLPKGMVNRQAPLLQAPSAWSGLVAQNLSKAQTAKLDITSNYNPNNHYINITVKTTFKSAWPNSVNLMLLLTQDSIISDQEDGAPPAGATIDPNNPIRRLNYRFDHIVIGSVNDPMGGSGELVKKGPVNVGDTATSTNSCFLISKCFFKNEKYPSVCIDDKHINIVAFVYDIVTQEVLQVEQMKIKP